MLDLCLDHNCLLHVFPKSPSTNSMFAGLMPRPMLRQERCARLSQLLLPQEMDPLFFFFCCLGISELELGSFVRNLLWMVKIHFDFTIQKPWFDDIRPPWFKDHGTVVTSRVSNSGACLRGHGPPFVGLLTCTWVWVRIGLHRLNCLFSISTRKKGQPRNTTPQKKPSTPSRFFSRTLSLATGFGRAKAFSGRSSFRGRGGRAT